MKHTEILSAPNPSAAAASGSGSVQEVYVPSATWQQTVAFYSTALQQSPNPTGPETAVFKLRGDDKLHVTKTDDTTLLAGAARKPTLFIPLPKPEWVKQAMEDAQGAGAETVIPLTDIEVFPVLNENDYRLFLTMGSVRFPVVKQAVAQSPTLGVIHNPNW